MPSLKTLQKLIEERGPVAVLGANGQLGRALLTELGESGRGLDRASADLSAVAAVIPVLEALKPSILINAAAYTQVDRAETEQEAACLINGEAPGVLAAWARSKDIPFVHYSTDYVFSDDGDPPGASRARTETFPTAPINAYGRSKLEGEQRVAAAGGRYLIFRTSWVYDATGKNFVNTILRLARERDTLQVVDDQIGAPTFARDLARATLDVLAQAAVAPVFPAGIYHMTNAGETSWFGFAHRVLDEARSLGMSFKATELKPIPSSEFPTPAPRPKNSRLSGAKLKRTFGVELRPWAAALRECMVERVKAGLDR